MNRFHKLVLIATAIGIAFVSCQETKEDVAAQVISTFSNEDKIELGKKIFFDTNLSNPIGQSCGSCHSPETAFSDPQHRAFSPGADPKLFVVRHTPSIKYLGFSEKLLYSYKEETYKGGVFWDGRVNSLSDQAKFPLLNKLEMGNTDKQMVVDKIKKASYYADLVKIYGNEVKASDDVLFNSFVDAIVAYEKSPELNPFTSKFDAFVEGKTTLTVEEALGMKIYNDTTKSKCSTCHSLEPSPESKKILMTDFGYDNLGIPKNPENPFYKLGLEHNPLGAKHIDIGLEQVTNDPETRGKFKVSSLRNVELTAPYGHNGYFKTLEEIVHFYNVRDVEKFPEPEVASTINKEEMGNLKMTKAEEKALVEFMKTFTDGFYKK